MSVRAASHPLWGVPLWPARLIGPLAVIGLTGFSALLVAVMGLWALVLPAYSVMAALAIVRPKTAAAVLLFMAIVIEPEAFDPTRHMSAAFWRLPPGFENFFHITISPMEILVWIAAISAVVQYPSRVKLPLIAWGIPAVIVLGGLYGLAKGGASNIAYHEARGLLTGIAVFMLASRVLPERPGGLVKLVLAAEFLLGLVVIFRYVAYVRAGTLTVPLEAAFSHEGSVVMGIGVVLGAIVFLQDRQPLQTRLLLLGYTAVLLLAMVATQRRAATLVLLVGALSVGVLLFRRRPMLVLAVSIPMLIGGTAYLGAYWNKEYGALAQPARAIRSQFDPTLRDESSDQYRTTEKYNIVETIRLNRVFGVGLGRPFIQFQPLPDLRSFWPLQQYTPHQNVLWLWLKFGVLGIATVLGFAVVALNRSLHAVLHSRGDTEFWLGVMVFSGLLMFLIYSTVDLGFVGSRSVAPAAILAALAFRLGAPRSEP